MGKTNPRAVLRARRKKSIRKKVRGSAERPRLAVFRSAKHIYAQLIDDDAGKTMASASSLCTEVKSQDVDGGNRGGAEAVGKLLAERAATVDIKSAVFDRGGFLYHGRIAALADGARAGGLEF